jgi:hypothetical protein
MRADPLPSMLCRCRRLSRRPGHRTEAIDAWATEGALARYNLRAGCRMSGRHSSMVEQLICNQQVWGSSPHAGFSGAVWQPSFTFPLSCLPGALHADEVRRSKSIQKCRERFGFKPAM